MHNSFCSVCKGLGLRTVFDWVENRQASMPSHKQVEVSQSMCASLSRAGFACGSSLPREGRTTHTCPAWPLRDVRGSPAWSFPGAGRNTAWEIEWTCPGVLGKLGLRFTSIFRWCKAFFKHPFGIIQTLDKFVCFFRKVPAAATGCSHLGRWVQLVLKAEGPSGCVEQTSPGFQRGWAG